MERKPYVSPKLESCIVFDDTTAGCTHWRGGPGCYDIPVKQSTCRNLTGQPQDEVCRFFSVS